MKTAAFEGFAGFCAILAGLAGFLYSLAFIVIARSAPNAGALLSALFLTLGGLLSAAALSGLYRRVREVDGGFALLALILGVTAALGSALHGGYDLAKMTGRQIVLTSIAISRIPAGKLAENWNETDGLGVLRQLGFMPNG